MRFSPGARTLAPAFMLFSLVYCQHVALGQLNIGDTPPRNVTLPASSPSTSPSSTSPSSTLSPSFTWLSLPDCPVLLERSVEVPAQETGVLKSLEIELNASVSRDQVLARMDDELTLKELNIARLNHAEAVDQAHDDSQVRLHKLALKDAESELENHNAISKSVAASELRRLNLNVASAAVQVQMAERALKRAAIQAELSAATLQAATLRLERRQVKSPLSGIVTAIHAKPGQWVETGKTVVVVSDLEQLMVDCLIPIEKIDLKRVVGLEVRVEATRNTSGSAPVRLAGRITSYDPQISSQGLVRVHSKIQNVRQDGHWQLLPGMNVRLEVAVPNAGSQDSPALISRQKNATSR